jgi:hypothetical protein
MFVESNWIDGRYIWHWKREYKMDGKAFVTYHHHALLGTQAGTW